MTDPALERRDFITGLELLAQFLHEHPSFPTPPIVTFNIFPLDRDEFVRIVRALGGGDKNAVGSWFFVRKEFGSLRLEVNIARDLVCKKVVKGTRVIPETVVPAHIEEDVEWVCDEPLFANSAAGGTPP